MKADRPTPGANGVTLAGSDETLKELVVCDYVEDALSFTVPPGNELEFGWLGLDREVTVRTS